MDARRFPIMAGERGEGGRRSIPWALIEPQEPQARRNHGQSLQRLAERGGLDIVEAYAVLRGLEWRDVRRLDPKWVRSEVDRMVEEYEMPAKLKAYRDELVAWCRDMIANADHKLVELTYQAVIEHVEG